MFGIFACHQLDKERRTKSPVHLVTDELNYFVYEWYYPKGKWEFYLDHYVNVDKNGQFKLMVRDSLQKSQYFIGIINDTIAKLIDQTFSGDRLKTSYKSDSIQNKTYDGYTYCFDYKIGESRQNQKIEFIQNRSPEIIRALSGELDNLVLNSKATQIDSLDIAAAIEEFKKNTVLTLGEPPKIERAKFKAVSIRP